MKGINYQLILDYIKNNKLSKSDFCKVCKISIGTLNNILINNVQNMRYTTIRKLCYYTKLNAHKLFDI